MTNTGPGDAATSGTPFGRPRIDVTPKAVELMPRQAVTIAVDIANTSNVIDGYQAYIIGVDPAWVTAEPASVQLFPGERGRIILTVLVSGTFPAGEHPLAVKVISTLDPTRSAVAEIMAVVASVADNQIRLAPTVVTTNKRGRFDIILTNDSNIDHTFDLAASDPERRVKTHIRPNRVNVRAGGMATARMSAVGGRPVFGSAGNRVLTVEAESQGQRIQTNGTLIQNPIIPRWALPLMVLLAVLGLWLVILLPIVKHLANRKGASGDITNAAFNATAAATQAGKGPPANGIAGKVSVSTSGLPLAGAVLAAFPNSSPVALAASAATGADGTYRISGLMPGSYRIKLTADGFPVRWFPQVTSFNAGKDVAVIGGQTTKGIDIQLAGLPGSINGAVLVPPPVAPTVSAVPGAKPPSPADASGVAVILQPVVPGTAAAAGGGSGPGIGGIASAAPASPCAGGAPTSSLSTNAFAGSNTTTTTPTVTVPPLNAGSALGPPQTRITDPSGSYAFTNLVTPATYQVTFHYCNAAFNYADQVTNVTLGPGETRVAAPVSMSSTSVGASVSGLVTSDGKTGLGGVSVVATNGNVTFSTTTLSQAVPGHGVGSYLLNGLPAGSFTLTFKLDGFNPISQAVTATPGTAVVVPNVTLAKANAIIVGTISGPAGPLPGATVTVTDGTTTLTATSADNPAGTYELDGVPATTVTVSVADSGYSSQVEQIAIAPGSKQTVNITLKLGVGAIIGTIMAVPQTGQPFPIPNAVTITTLAAPPGTPIPAAINAGADGSFALTNLVPGAYDLTVTSPGYAKQFLHVPVPPNVNVVETVKMIPDLGSIGGSVLGPTISQPSAPLQGVTITIAPITAGAGAPLTATTGPDGSWTLPNIPPLIPYQITYALAGYQAFSQTETVDAGQALQLQAVTLAAAPGGINGQVVGPTGPLDGILITVTKPDGSTLTASSTKTSPFRFDNLVTPGTYQLAFTGVGFQTTNLTVQLGPGDVRALGNISMQATTATVSGLVLGPVTAPTEEAPVAGATVTLTSPVGTFTATTGQPVLVQGQPETNYTFKAIPTSTTPYTLTVTQSGYAPSAPISVPVLPTVPTAPGGTPGPILINAPTVVITALPGSITGTVIGSDGSVLVGAQITATSSAPGATQQATDTQVASRPFSITPLVTPALYTLTITTPTGSIKPVTIPVQLNPGQNAQLGNIQTSQLVGTLRAQIVDGADNGLPGSTVTVTLKNGQGQVFTPPVDSQGRFVVANLTPGTYTVTVTPPNPYPVTLVDIPVPAGDPNPGVYQRIVIHGHPVIVSGTTGCTTQVPLNLDLGTDPSLGPVVDSGTVVETIFPFKNGTGLNTFQFSGVPSAGTYFIAAPSSNPAPTPLRVDVAADTNSTGIQFAPVPGACKK